MPELSSLFDYAVFVGTPLIFFFLLLLLHRARKKLSARKNEVDFLKLEIEKIRSANTGSKLGRAWLSAVSGLEEHANALEQLANDHDDVDQKDHARGLWRIVGEIWRVRCQFEIHPAITFTSGDFEEALSKAEAADLKSQNKISQANNQRLRSLAYQHDSQIEDARASMKNAVSLAEDAAKDFVDRYKEELKNLGR